MMWIKLTLFLAACLVFTLLVPAVPPAEAGDEFAPGLEKKWTGVFCEDALASALDKYGKPEIFNTDQGVQFTAKAFTGHLKEAKIKISMDGRGRFVDNIFIERLWRSVKHENIYLNEYETGVELTTALSDYFDFYDHDRYHQSLDYRRPAEVYFT